MATVTRDGVFVCQSASWCNVKDCKKVKGALKMVPVNVNVSNQGIQIEAGKLFVSRCVGDKMLSTRFDEL